MSSTQDAMGLATFVGRLHATVKKTSKTCGEAQVYYRNSPKSPLRPSLVRWSSLDNATLRSRPMISPRASTKTRGGNALSRTGDAGLRPKKIIQAVLLTYFSAVASRLGAFARRETMVLPRLCATSPDPQNLAPSRLLLPSVAAWVRYSTTLLPTVGLRVWIEGTGVDLTQPPALTLPRSENGSKGAFLFSEPRTTISRPNQQEVKVPGNFRGSLGGNIFSNIVEGP